LGAFGRPVTVRSLAANVGGLGCVPVVERRQRSISRHVRTRRFRDRREIDTRLSLCGCTTRYQDQNKPVRSRCVHCTSPVARDFASQRLRRPGWRFSPRPSRGSHDNRIRRGALSKLNLGPGHRTMKLRVGQERPDVGLAVAVSGNELAEPLGRVSRPRKQANETEDPKQAAKTDTDLPIRSL